MTSFRSDAVRVRAPATSANLGPGYDSLGLALQFHDEVQARVTAHGYTMSTNGEGGSFAEAEPALVVRAMLAAFERLGGKPAGLALHCTNRIPHGRGLGSSAAAIVTGVLLARALVLDGTERLPDAEAFALAVDIEGHPDNVAACFHGGLTVAWTDSGTPHAVRMAVTAAIRPVLFLPPFESATKHARGLLPTEVPHADAAFGAGRSALLVAALTGAVPPDHDLMLAATEDRLHQDYRAPVFADSIALVRALRASGTAAVVSGAGPSVLAFALDPEEADRLAERTPPGWRCLALPVERDGARIL
jgi:homoserine kinase